MLQELERVALTQDLPEHGLSAGDVGMIVHVYGDHKGYEVEFVTFSGDLVALESEEFVFSHNTVNNKERIKWSSF